MIGFLIAVTAVVVAFVLGAIYGRDAEARAIATGLRLESYGRQELVAVIAKIRTFEGEVFTRIKKFL